MSESGAFPAIFQGRWPPRPKGQHVADELTEIAETPVAAAETETQPKGKSRRGLAIGAAAALLLAGAGGAGYYFLAGDSAVTEEAKAKPAPTYVEVPPMTVNLRSPDGQQRFLKLRFILVPGEAGKEEALKEKLPLLLDAYQPFLRELRPEDLAGSAAVFRLKEEMVVRAAGVLGPGAVSDVLIQDLVQQ